MLPISLGALNATLSLMSLHDSSTRFVIFLAIVSHLSFVYGSDKYLILIGDSLVVLTVVDVVDASFVVDVDVSFVIVAAGVDVGVDSLGGVVDNGPVERFEVNLSNSLKMTFVG
jgi:hypothetical protein